MTQLPKDQFEIATGKAKDINRGTIVSRKTDDVKDLTIGLRDHDFAVRYYFQNVIKPRVVENDRVIDVPVLYANPERWKSVQRDGHLRDEKDKILLPLIVFKRNSIAKDDTYSVDKLDANNPMLFYPFKKRWSEKNKYDNFNLSVGRVPTTEFFNVVIPDYVIITYDFIVLTETIEQMNRIVESVLYSEGAYWGEKDRFKFRTKINNYTDATEIGADVQRTIKTTFNLELHGYLVPDTINKQLPLAAGNFERVFSPKQVIFGVETSIPLTTQPPSPSVPSLTSAQGGVIEVLSSPILDYLALNITMTASSVTANTATFSGVNMYAAPENSGFETTKESFHFFINGQHVSNTFVLSVEDVGTDVVVTFDSVGYALDSSDTVVSLGKFRVL